MDVFLFSCLSFFLSFFLPFCLSFFLYFLFFFLSFSLSLSLALSLCLTLSEMSCHVNAKFIFPAFYFECAVSWGLEVSDFIFSVRIGFVFQCCSSLCNFNITCFFVHYFCGCFLKVSPMCVPYLFQQGCSKQISLYMVWWWNSNLLTAPWKSRIFPKSARIQTFKGVVSRKNSSYYLS